MILVMGIMITLVIMTMWWWEWCGYGDGGYGDDGDDYDEYGDDDVGGYDHTSSYRSVYNNVFILASICTIYVMYMSFCSER